MPVGEATPGVCLEGPGPALPDVIDEVDAGCWGRLFTAGEGERLAANVRRGLCFSVPGGSNAADVARGSDGLSSS